MKKASSSNRIYIGLRTPLPRSISQKHDRKKLYLETDLWKWFTAELQISTNYSLLLFCYQSATTEV